MKFCSIMPILLSKFAQKLKRLDFNEKKPHSRIMKIYVFLNRLKADKELVKDVYSAAKRLKMERVKQVQLFSKSILLSQADSIMNKAENCDSVERILIG